MAIRDGMAETKPGATASRILITLPDGKTETFGSYSEASDYVDWLENQGVAADVEVLEI